MVCGNIRQIFILLSLLFLNNIIDLVRRPRLLLFIITTEHLYSGVLHYDDVFIVALLQHTLRACCHFE